MKKTILFALFALALPASAASIEWTMATGRVSSNYMVDSDGNKLNGVAYLMLTDSLTGVTFSSQDEIKELSLGQTGVSITDGYNTDDQIATDSRLTAPTLYSFTVLVYDTAKNSYYLSAAREQTAFNLSGDEYTDHKGASFENTHMYASAATRGTQTWTAVPEPSTAALALAGLALLLKRRKA